MKKLNEWDVDFYNKKFKAKYISKISYYVTDVDTREVVKVFNNEETARQAAKVYAKQFSSKMAISKGRDFLYSIGPKGGIDRHKIDLGESWLNEDLSSEDFEFNGATLIKCLTNKEHLVIPYGTVSIASDAFAYKSLKSVIIPDTVIFIGPGAFEYCENLEFIEIPDSVRRIGSYAFHSSGIKYAKLSNSLSVLEDHLFLRCSNLESVEIPDSVITIRKSVFDNCLNLKTVKLSKNLTFLDDFVFDCCKKLSNIEIPESLKDLDNVVFTRSGLEYVKLPSTLKWLNLQTFAYCENLKQIEGTLPLDCRVFNDIKVNSQTAEQVLASYIETNLENKDAWLITSEWNVKNMKNLISKLDENF